MSLAGLVIGALAFRAPLTAGDQVVALSACVVLVLFAAHGALHAHRRAVNAAVARERGRITRELHDGLAQDLAFVVTQCSQLAYEPRFRRIGEAAQSALAESRRVMLALRRPAEGSLAGELAQVARHATDRAGLRLDLRLAGGVEVPPAVRVELSRILSEAIANTARHAQATTVCVELTCEGGTKLTITDDGIGFERDRTAAVFGGFGILGMRERVKQLGGELRIGSVPLHGTRVEVLLP